MSHFYDENGNSCFEVETKTGKNAGKMRPATIRDAKANNWYPSCTTILEVISKPSLDGWKQDQVVAAARYFFQRLATVVRNIDHQTEALQDFLGHLLIDFIIFNQQNPRPVSNSP